VVETGRAAEVLAPEAKVRHPTPRRCSPRSRARRRYAENYLQAIEGEVLDTIEVPPRFRFYGRATASPSDS